MYDNKKRILTLLIVIALVFAIFTIYISSADTDVSARAATLYVPETDSFIYNKNENERLAMASTTKIMTALIALESLDKNELIEIPEEACGIEGSSLYLEKGKRFPATQNSGSYYTKGE